jgi:hypothetical protein
MLTLRPAISRIRRLLVGAPPRALIGPPRPRNFADVAARTIQTEHLDRLMTAFDPTRPRQTQ